MVKQQSLLSPVNLAVLTAINRYFMVSRFIARFGTEIES